MAHVRSLFFTGAASESEAKAQAAKVAGHPSSLIWNITNRCNLKCSHCYMAADAHILPDQLTDEQTIELVDRMHDAGCPVVFLSGGEPMMRSNFWEILERVHSYGIKPTISTNCTVVTEENAQRLKENGVKWIATSFYGPRAYHDELTQVPGTYDKVMNAIRILRKADVGVVLKTAITVNNWPYIYDMIQTAKDLDCGIFYICDLITSGRSEGEEALRISKAQWRELCDFIVDDMLDPDSHMEYDIGAIPSTIPYIAEKFIERGADVSKGLHRLSLFSACPVGQGHMAINSEGNIMPCQFSQEWTVGNIRDMSIEDAVKLLRTFDEQPSEGQCAPDACAFTHICRGCRVKAWMRTGAEHGGNSRAEDISCILDKSSGERDIDLATAPVAPCQGGCGA